MRIALGVAQGVLVAAFPFVLLMVLSHWGARVLGLVVLAFALPRALLAFAGARPEDRVTVLRVPLTVLGLGTLSAALRDPRFVQAAPALVNLGLLANFAASLRGDVPLVERFARMQVADLTPPERAYCRALTKLWCAFFVLNASACVALAVLAPVRWWALFTGVVGYALVGGLFAVEFIVRKIRFRRYGAGLPDRVFAWFFPRRACDP